MNQINLPPDHTHKAKERLVNRTPQRDPHPASNTEQGGKSIVISQVMNKCDIITLAPPTSTTQSPLKPSPITFTGRV